MAPDPVLEGTGTDLHLRLRAIVARLDELQDRFEREHDSRAVFTCIYSIMTAEIDRHLDTMGLRDPSWLVSLAEVFVCRYLDAVEAADAGLPVCPAWQAVFEAIRARSSVLEDAVYPMTAHIVHDLPLALLDVGFDTQNGSSHLHDFDCVNTVMEESIDRIRRDVTRRYSPALRFLDRMERNYDVILSSYGIRMSRSQAWYDAIRLCDPMDHQDALDLLESRPIELIKCVREPRDSRVAVALGLVRAFASLFRRWSPGPARRC